MDALEEWRTEKDRQDREVIKEVWKIAGLTFVSTMLLAALITAALK